MARHSKPFKSLNDKENDTKFEKSVSEETTDSKKNSVFHSHPNSPIYSNGNILETKLSESEAKISKLISEIDLLKKKVSVAYIIVYKICILW